MAKKSLNMMEKVMDPNINDYYIINCAIPRGVYSGKSDCLVLPKSKSFYGKLAKIVMVLD